MLVSLGAICIPDRWLDTHGLGVERCCHCCLHRGKLMYVLFAWVQFRAKLICAGVILHNKYSLWLMNLLGVVKIITLILYV